MKSVDSQLVEAEATIVTLRADAVANAALLSESATALTAAQAEIVTLNATLGEAQITRDTLSAENAAFVISVGEKDAQLAELNGVQEKLGVAEARVVTLEAEAKTAEQRAAEIYGATRKPLAVTPGGDPKASDATIAKLDAFEAIDDPTAQANAWNAFTQPEREALIAAQKARKNSKSR